MTLMLSNTLRPFGLVIVSILIGFSSCADNESVSLSTEDYYLNHVAFAGNGVVYRYESVNDMTLPDEYWHYRYSAGRRGNYFHSTMYLQNGQIVQRTKERLTREMSQLLSLDLTYTDERGIHEIPTQVLDNQTFIFGPIDSTTTAKHVISYWDTSVDSVRVVFNKERILLGSMEYEYNGQLLTAIHVRTKELLETETEGFTTSEWEGEEIYAQDIGLVYYKKTISPVFALEYRLAETLPFSFFQSKTTEPN